jgi:hypothetical protein
LIAEMASLRIPGINALPEPLATVIFHYSPTMDYRPEFTSMVGANAAEDQVQRLRETYGAGPNIRASRSCRCASPPKNSRRRTGNSRWARLATSPPTSAN